MSTGHSVEEQKTKWANRISQNLDHEGYVWGNPEDVEAKTSCNNYLGNYRKIKDDLVLRYINENTVILDYGSYAGKWTKYFLSAKNVICSDIFEESGEYIKNKLKNDKISFHLTNGFELPNIQDQTVDFIFSIDTLVRTEVDVLQKLIHTFSRILKKDGRALIHLPCNKQRKSVENNFTDLDEEKIISMFHENKLKISLDYETLIHGVLVKVNYD
jgi:ubiquinone/menaquinone biosynthesis C-methylase UbiE